MQGAIVENKINNYEKVANVNNLDLVHKSPEM
jgi:hypothetical protein